MNLPKTFSLIIFFALLSAIIMINPSVSVSAGGNPVVTPTGGQQAELIETTSATLPKGVAINTNSRITPKLGQTYLLQEGFEGAFPEDNNWSVSDCNPADGKEYFWDDTNYKPFIGGWSGWPANGGANGISPTSEFTFYPPNMCTWMTAGPFDLRGAGSGSVYLKYWNKSEFNFDFFKWMVSANGTNYYGYVHSGDSGGWVTSTSIDLANVPTIGNILGDDSVWVALTFDSDSSNQNQGVFVDSVTLEAVGSAPGAFNKSSPANGVSGLPTSLTLSWNTSSNASSYSYCYDMTNDNTCGGSWTSADAGTSALVSGLSLGTTYFWQARADNSFGTTYANGNAWWSFTPGSMPPFTVNSPTDAVDAAPGNSVCATAGGVCTLRAAIQEANARPGDDSITVSTGTYTLMIAGRDEDAAATGDLDITSNITLNGAGAGSTIIQAGTLGVGGPPNGIDRVFHIPVTVTVNLSGVTIRNGNNGYNDLEGGGIFVYGVGTLTITNSTISDNTAYFSGGGISGRGTVTIANSIVSGNSSTGYWGGGISQTGGSLIITNSTISGNSAHHYGGGISRNGGTVTITNSTFSGNSAAWGGGISNGYLSPGILNISNSIFTDNSAPNGGGIFNQRGTVNIMNSTFSGNSAALGGCIANYSMLTVTNSTFSGNSASDEAGGVYNGVYNDTGTANILNSTFSGNSASSGGGIVNATGTVSLTNTIVANSTSGGNCSGAIINDGNNLDSGTTCGWGSTSGSMSNTNPLLGALTSSPAYFPLLSGSPAIDAGNDAFCPATDQRGVTRPQGARCDIGSFELDLHSLFLPLILR